MKPAKTPQKWILRATRPYMVQVVLLSVISFLTSLSAVGFALLSRQVIDRATGDASGSFWMSGVLLLLMLVGRVLLGVWYNYLSAWLTSRLRIRIKDRIFSTLFKKRWKDLSAFHSGELLHRMNDDCGTVVSGVVGFTPHVVSMVTSIIACIVVLLTMDWKFTLVLLGIGGVMLLLSHFYGLRQKSLFKNCQVTAGKAKAFAQEGLTNWTMIQSFNGGEAVRQRLAYLHHLNFKATIRNARWGSIAHAAAYLLFNGSYYIALLWGAVRLTLPGGGMTFGALTALLQIVSQIRAPFMNMSGLLPQYYNMQASAERIMELEDLPDEPRLPQLYEASDLYSRMQHIRVDNVSFSYDEEKIVLDGADFTLNKGEFVALAGFSGIGKTTLFKLMLGFYPLNTGELYAQVGEDKVPLGADTRCLFAYVPQQSMLLSGTIRENIAFCCGEVSDDAIWAAAEVADVADAIRQQPDGLDTILGERGSGLSEGQLQRLAIARAVLSGAPILLLDECTASLDEATEERVLQRLRALDRTCLCISHRPAALEICDRVVRVVDGKFVED